MIPIFSHRRFRVKLLKWSGFLTLTVVLGAALSLAIPGCSVGYLIRAGYFQAELMLSRVPVEDARDSGRLTEDEIRALDDFADVKTYGAEIGLSASENYETIALDWPREIWNITACDPVAFEPHRWWFPIVGSVPYLGYFREDEVREARSRLLSQDYDIYIRSVGAYSTLGWFEDPILPWMLEWSTHRIAQTTLHELVHATIWIPGSVKFNESFANFVGKEAAMRYLVDRYGEDGEVTIQARSSSEDSETLRRVLHEVYTELDDVYQDPSLERSEILSRKAEILDSIPERVSRTEFLNPEKVLKSVQRGPWNNARLIQFKTYNHNQDIFQALLDAEGGDLLSFMRRVESITSDADDPFAAIRAASL
jgi:predicted aminopeptidase